MNTEKQCRFTCIDTGFGRKNIRSSEECPLKSHPEWKQGFDDAFGKACFDGTKRRNRIYCCGYNYGLEMLKCE